MVEDLITHKGNVSELGRPHLARRRSDGGPQREPYGARRWGTDEESDALHSTVEALEQSRDERWRRAWREGSAVEGKASSNACSGHRAGLSMSPTRRAYGSKRDHRYGLARRSRLTFDRSPVRESRTPGSVRGAVSNHRPYRDPTYFSAGNARATPRSATEAMSALGCMINSGSRSRSTG